MRATASRLWRTQQRAGVYAWPRVLGGALRLAGARGGRLALGGVAERARDPVALEGAAGARPVHDLEADLLEAVHDPLLGLLEQLLRHAAAQVERLGPHARRADHRGDTRRRVLQVAAHAVRVLAVELAL